MPGGIGPERLGRLYDAHAAALILYARQWSDRAEAEDLVHDAFLALASEHRPPDDPAAWLFRVVRNGAVSRVRRLIRRRTRDARVARREALFSATDDRVDAEEAAGLLASLTSEVREVVVARIWGGLTFEAIAALLGGSLTTAHRRYHDGLARLQERLDSPCTPKTSRSATSNDD